MKLLLRYISQKYMHKDQLLFNRLGIEADNISTDQAMTIN